MIDFVHLSDLLSTGRASSCHRNRGIIMITMQHVSLIIQQSEKGTRSSRVVWCSHASSMKFARSFGTSFVLSVHPRDKIWIDLFMTDGMMLSSLNYKLEFQIQPRRSCARQPEIFTISRSRPAENLHTRVPFTGMYKWYHGILESGNTLATCCSLRVNELTRSNELVIFFSILINQECV